MVPVWKKPMDSLISRCSHKGKVACSLSMCQVFPAERVNFWQPNQPNFHAAWNNTFCAIPWLHEMQKYRKTQLFATIWGLFQPGNSEHFHGKNLESNSPNKKWRRFSNPLLFFHHFSRCTNCGSRFLFKLMDHPSLTSHEFFGPNGLPEIFLWFLWFPHFILQAPSVPKRTVELCVHMLDIFWWVIFFSDPLDAKKIPPTNGARKSMNPCPRSSEAPIWKTSTSTGLMFTAMELAFDLVVVGCSGDICWRIPFSLSAWRWCFFGQWPLRRFRAVLSQV